MGIDLVLGPLVLICVDCYGSLGRLDEPGCGFEDQKGWVWTMYGLLGSVHFF